MRLMQCKELESLRLRAIEQGWRVERSNGDHYKWYAPDGKTIIVSGSTPSDRRAVKNQRSLMRRAGFHD